MYMKMINVRARAFTAIHDHRRLSSTKPRHHDTRDSRAVRASVGDDYPVGCRFLSDEIIAHGSGIDDACYFATEFARAGMDFLSLSRGGKFDDAKQPKVG